MGGIFGIVDPDGTDPDWVRDRVTSAAPHRGAARVFDTKFGVVGAFFDSRIAEDPGSRGGIELLDGWIEPLDGPGEPEANKFDGPSLVQSLTHLPGHRLSPINGEFAFAHLGEGGLLLARDPVGTRPLFWSIDGRRVAFGPDPALLRALGFGSEVVDPRAVSIYLTFGDTMDAQTGFTDVWRVPGGHTISFDGMRVRSLRWFRPETAVPVKMDLDEAGTRVREALAAALRSRAPGQRIALLLTGGRDSGAVAVALADAGYRAECITYRTEPDSEPSEQESSAALARYLGFGWTNVLVPTSLGDDLIREMARASGGPLGASLPNGVVLRDAVARARATIVMSGEGGDLFQAPPVAVSDLLLRGRFGPALRAIRAYGEAWVYPPSAVARWMLHALKVNFPGVYDIGRDDVPPWVVHRDVISLSGKRRSARGALLSALLRCGYSSEREMAERLYAQAGARYSCPLFDLRVVKELLSLPLALRLPIPEPKPALGRGVLRDQSAGRVKAKYSPYFVELSRRLQDEHQEAFDPGSPAARLGLVRRSGLSSVGADKWCVDALGLLPLHTWLSTQGEE
jgi:asparagine synthetase B (glutamine-hydrolysing)